MSVRLLVVASVVTTEERHKVVRQRCNLASGTASLFSNGEDRANLDDDESQERDD
jgi:hypothetical protein